MRRKVTLKCTYFASGISGAWGGKCSGGSEKDKIIPSCSCLEPSCHQGSRTPRHMRVALNERKAPTVKDRLERGELVPYLVGVALSFHKRLKYCPDHM